jgi:hypothetical protein
VVAFPLEGDPWSLFSYNPDILE